MSEELLGQALSEIDGDPPPASHVRCRRCAGHRLFVRGIGDQAGRCRARLAGRPRVAAARAGWLAGRRRGALAAQQPRAGWALVPRAAALCLSPPLTIRRGATRRGAVFLCSPHTNDCTFFISVFVHFTVCAPPPSLFLKQSRLATFAVDCMARIRAMILGR